MSHDATLPPEHLRAVIDETAKVSPIAAEAAAAARHEPRNAPPEDLTRFAVLSIVAAVVTITLKMWAWRITGSVGLLSDATETIVNLVAAVVALVALRMVLRGPSKKHNFGMSKAEYFSAATEGVMILLAALIILETSVRRFLHPRPLEQVGWGLVVSVVASLVNGGVAWVLFRAGRQHRSITLTADAKHLLADVWTSIGVLVGVGLVWLTHWQRLDAIVAFLVALNIIWTGWHLIAESTAGLLDVSLPKEENAAIRAILDRHTSAEMLFHAVRTRESGNKRFLEFHMLVPGAMSVKDSHDACEELIDELVAEFPDLRVMAHVEPLEDPRSYEDIVI